MDENLLVMAEALALGEVEEGIRKTVALLPKQPPDFDGCCEDCGEEIPAARLKFGAVTCLQCQVVREKRAALPKRF